MFSTYREFQRAILKADFIAKGLSIVFMFLWVIAVFVAIGVAGALGLDLAGTQQADKPSYSAPVLLAVLFGGALAGWLLCHRYACSRWGVKCPGCGHRLRRLGGWGLWGPYAKALLRGMCPKCGTLLYPR